MIWDVLDWIEKAPIQWIKYDRPWGNPTFVFHDQMVIRKRKEKRLPIEDQEDTCIDYIFWLIESEK